MNRLRELTEELLPTLDRPRFIAAEEFGVVRPGASRLGPVEGALLCPLMLKDRPAGDPHIGVLCVYGQQPVLDELSPALEILAGQAALAVERVTLTQEVIRQRGQALFRTLVRNTSDAILIIGDDGLIAYATPSAAAIFGDVEVEGNRLEDLVDPETRADVARVMDLILAGITAGTHGFLLRIERLDGRDAVLEVRSSDLRGDRTVGGMVLTLRDVTEQHQLEQELKHQAFHDALTGLPNRVLFAERVGRRARPRAPDRAAPSACSSSTWTTSRWSTTRWATASATSCWPRWPRRLAASVRPSDTAARLGGDEFALLIDDAPRRRGGGGVRGADRGGVHRAVHAQRRRGDRDRDRRRRHLGRQRPTRTSCCATPTWPCTRRRRRASAAGGATSRCCRRACSGGARCRSALEDALKNSEFTLAYQPIVTLAQRRDRRLRGADPLAAPAVGHDAARPVHRRWRRRPVTSCRSATGCCRQALADMVQWRRRMEAPLDGGPHVSVNVSARQFRDPGFVDGVRQALLESGLPPSALLLELTESVLLGDNDRIGAELEELKDIGVRLAIDDFGTGYSSLSYLLQLPINVLKIDKSFVTGIAASWRQYALVEGIVRLAGTLEVEVIAEGIETETERELLAGMGCQYGQGYLLSVPVEAAKAEALLSLGHGLAPELPRQRRKPPDHSYLTDL